MVNLKHFVHEGNHIFKYDPEFFSEEYLRRVMGADRGIVLAEPIDDEEEDPWIVLDEDDASTIFDKVYKKLSEREDFAGETLGDIDSMRDDFLNRIDRIQSEGKDDLEKRADAFAKYKSDHLNYETREENGTTYHLIDGDVVLEYDRSLICGLLGTSNQVTGRLALYLDFAFTFIDLLFFILALTDLYMKAPARSGRSIGKYVMEAMEDGRGELKTIWKNFFDGTYANLSEELKKIEALYEGFGNKRAKAIMVWWKNAQKVKVLRSLLRRFSILSKSLVVFEVIKGILSNLTWREWGHIAINFVASVSILVASAGTSLLAAVAVAVGWLVILFVDLLVIHEEVTSPA